MRTLLLTALFASVVSAGCARKQHLSKEWGNSYDTAFAAQRAPAVPGAPTEPVSGLDSQEAAIISDSYRNSLARKSEKVEEQPILMVAPRDRYAGQQPKLAPSVPPKE